MAVGTRILHITLWIACDVCYQLSFMLHTVSLSWQKAFTRPPARSAKSWGDVLSSLLRDPLRKLRMAINPSLTVKSGAVSLSCEGSGDRNCWDADYICFKELLADLWTFCRPSQSYYVVLRSSAHLNLNYFVEFWSDL